MKQNVYCHSCRNMKKSLRLHICKVNYCVKTYICILISNQKRTGERKQPECDHEERQEDRRLLNYRYLWIEKVVVAVDHNIGLLNRPPNNEQKKL
jgi:hypothetical protein